MIDHTTGLERQVRTLRKRSMFTLFLTWLALFFTIIGIAAGYKNFLRVHDKANAARDDAMAVMTLMPQMASKSSIENWQREIRSQLVSNQVQASQEFGELKSLKESNQYLESALKKQIEQLTHTQHGLSNNVSNRGDARKTWQVAEIRYLLKIASRQMVLNQDAETAIKALKAADQELIVLGEPDLLPIRDLIVTDIANLQEYKAADLSVVVQAIDDLSKQLKPEIKLEKQITRDPKAVAESDPTGGSDEKDGSILKRMQAKIDEAVVIKRYDDDLAKTIKGDTQQVRYELTRLKLESLKLLALKSQHNAYHTQLKHIAELLNEEHIGHLSDSVEAALARLESIDIKAKVPNLLAVKLLDELLASSAKEQP